MVFRPTILSPIKMSIGKGWPNTDILVAGVIIPSHGVGYEIVRAVAMNKKVICLYRNLENQELSSMIKGSPDVICYEYSNITHAKRIIRQSLI